MPWGDNGEIVKAIENGFYRKKKIPDYIRRIRKQKAIERNTITTKIAKEIKLGVRCRHGVDKEKCIVCDPKYKLEKIDVDRIPF